MKALVHVAAAGYAVLLGWYAVTLPERVPGHLGLDGQVTRWDSKGELMAVMGGIGLLMWLLFGLASRWLGRLPAEFLNVPHREFWTRPENRPEMVRLMSEDLALTGVATFVLLGWSLRSVAMAAYGDAPSGLQFGFALGLYLVVVIGWAVWAYAGPRYHLPEGTAAERRR